MVIGTKTHSITHHSLVYGRAMSATLTRDKYAEYFVSAKGKLEWQDRMILVVY